MEKKTELKIEYLPVGKLKPYTKNARLHTDKDLSTIIESIKEFGFADPIAVWSDKNIVVEGHGRLIAAKKLKMKQVPVIRLDHLTDEQRRAYALAHNKTAELSDWDYGILDTELGDILNIDMTNFGFDTNIGDVFEEPEPKPKTKDSYSVVIDCENDIEAEEIYRELVSQGFDARIE